MLTRLENTSLIIFLELIIVFVVSTPLMVRWVLGSITHDGDTGLFRVPASASQVVYVMVP